jgi:EF hand
MRSKTLIAIAVAGLLAAPLALAQSGSSSTTTPQGSTGPAGMDKRSSDDQTPPKADREKSASGSATSRSGSASTRGGADTSASSSGISGSAGASVSASEFRKMDKNKDGFLSKDEVEGNASLSSSFDQMDKNHDGKLARSEVSGSASASASGTTKGNSDRIARTDRGSSGTETAPNTPRNPKTPGDPPKQSGSPVPQ